MAAAKKVEDVRIVKSACTCARVRFPACAGPCMLRLRVRKLTSSTIDMSSSSSIAFCSNLVVIFGAAVPHPPLPPKAPGERSVASFASLAPVFSFLGLITSAREDMWRMVAAAGATPVLQLMRCKAAWTGRTGTSRAGNVQNVRCRATLCPATRHRALPTVAISAAIQSG